MDGEVPRAPGADQARELVDRMHRLHGLAVEARQDPHASRRSYAPLSAALLVLGAVSAALALVVRCAPHSVPGHLVVSAVSALPFVAGGAG